MLDKKIFLKNSIILVSIIIFCLFFLTGCSSNKEDLNAKVEEEINYLDDRIILMLNKMNNISFSNYVISTQDQIDNKDNQKEKSEKSDEQSNSKSSDSSSSSGSESNSNSDSSSSSSKQSHKSYSIEKNSILLNGTNQPINWNEIKSDIELLYSSWSTVVIDLHKLNIDNNDILNFSNVINDLTISAKNEDKTKTLIYMANLYSYLPKYLKQFSKDSTQINMTYAKANIINSYALIEQNKWDEMKSQLDSALTYYSNILNGINENEKQDKISKIYVLLNEFNNCIALKDKEVYYIKYRNLMEEIEDF